MFWCLLQHARAAFLTGTYSPYSVLCLPRFLNYFGAKYQSSCKMLQNVSSVNYFILLIFIAICADAKQEAIDILWFSRPRRQTKTAALSGIYSVLCFSWLGRQSWGSSEKLKKRRFLCRRKPQSPPRSGSGCSGLDLASKICTCGLKSEFDVCSNGDVLMVFRGFSASFFCAQSQPSGQWMGIVNLVDPPAFAFS